MVEHAALQGRQGAASPMVMPPLRSADNGRCSVGTVLGFASQHVSCHKAAAVATPIREAGVLASQAGARQSCTGALSL